MSGRLGNVSSFIILTSFITTFFIKKPPRHLRDSNYFDFVMFKYLNII